MNKPLRCVLVGMPGSGKTTIGRQLARRMGGAFLDCDHAIEREIGCSIKQFFQQQGEPAFRDLETQVLAELLQRPGPCVLSTGGGAVVRAENRALLKSGPPVVYLHAVPEEIHRRIAHDDSRPLMQVADPLAKLKELYRDRDPLYREVARYVMETGRPTMSSLVNTLLMQLELGGGDDIAVPPVEVAAPTPTVPAPDSAPAPASPSMPASAAPPRTPARRG